jgi:hypothetical protein
MITTLFLQEAQSDNPTEKILLPPTDPNAEVQEIPGYTLVYVNGACPRNYRVYKAATEQPLTEEELLDKEFDALTNDEWERLRKYVPQAKNLVAA